MKKLILLFCFLVLQTVLVKAQGAKKIICPPPCKGVQSDIFFETFCCKKTKKTEWTCLFHAWDELKNQCVNSQNAFVNYWDPEDYEPQNPVREANELSKERKRTTYICPTLHKKAVSWKYLSESGGAHVGIFDQYSDALLGVDLHLPVGLPLKDPLVQEAIKNMLDYACNYFDAKEFFHTQKAPPFQHTYTTREEMPDSDEASASSVGSPFSQQTNNSGQEKSAPANSAGSAAQAEQNTNQPAAPRVVTAQKAPEGARQIFDIFFYAVPTPGNLSTVRHFRTADKQQELKINFSSGDKSNFLQKLEKQFPKESSKVTHCKNKNTLFETQQDVYQVFILSPSAVTVLARPAGFSGAKPDKKQLCGFNAMLFW